MSRRANDLAWRWRGKEHGVYGNARKSAHRRLTYAPGPSVLVNYWNKLQREDKTINATKYPPFNFHR